MNVVALVAIVEERAREEVKLILNSEREANDLLTKLTNLQIGLQVAERAGVTDRTIQNWLKQLEDVIHDVDGLLDEWETAKQLQELGEDPPVGFVEKLSCCCHSIYLIPQRALWRWVIIKKMQPASQTIDRLLGEKNKFKLVEGEIQPPQNPPPATSQDDSKPIGRDVEADKIVKYLIADNSDPDLNSTHIISIVGVGGLGKTTLARLVYKDPRVEKRFPTKAWVDLVEPFEPLGVAKSILENLGKDAAGLTTLEAAQNLITNTLSQERFLLVLDNVSTEEPGQWGSLITCLQGQPGSKLLVTTRTLSVATALKSNRVETIAELSVDDCADILNNTALARRKPEECDFERLRKMGKLIAKKCCGSPFMALTLGRMLADYSAPEVWREILNSELWDPRDARSDKLYGPLKISYTNFASLEKSCFLISCTVFTKGSLISLDELMRVWMAFGYLQPRDSIDQVRSKGLQLFTNLKMRCFFIQGSSAGGGHYGHDDFTAPVIVHDRMHEFANYICRREYSFVLDGREAAAAKGKVSSNSREARATPPNWEIILIFCARHVSDKKWIEDNLNHLRRVCLLVISRCGLEEVPATVGKLFHLRYLDLSGNPIEALPGAVGDLVNLQTLGLEDCDKLIELPRRMSRLTKLRHIVNSGTDSLIKFPPGLGGVTGLWTLSEFRSTRGNLTYLKNMDQLQGSLRIILIQEPDQTTVDNSEPDVVGEPELEKKNYIRKLELLLYDAEESDKVVDALRPPPELYSIVIQGNTGKWLSKWGNPTCLEFLRVLEFSGCEKCPQLPQLGQLLYLEDLSVSNCQFEGLISGDFMGPLPDPGVPVCRFPKLKKLCFKSCNLWNLWEDISVEARSSYSIMPMLYQLDIEDCSALEKLPHLLLIGSLKILVISKCTLLEQTYGGRSGPDWDAISPIQYVKFV